MPIITNITDTPDYYLADYVGGIGDDIYYIHMGLEVPTDFDNDGIEDALDHDDDNDGVDDTQDAFPKNANESADSDSDGDGVGDNADVFPNNASESIDTDSDGTGNNADTDDDGDGDEVIDTADNCILLHNPNQDDKDNDGRGDVCDRIDDTLAVSVKQNSGSGDSGGGIINPGFLFLISLLALLRLKYIKNRIH